MIEVQDFDVEINGVQLYATSSSVATAPSLFTLITTNKLIFVVIVRNS